MMITHYFHEAKITFKLAIPFAANLILQMSIATIDSIMAGLDSDLTLAAVAQGVVLWNLVVLIVSGLFSPLTALVANAYARGEKNTLAQLFQQAIWLTFPVGLLAFLLMLLMPQVLVLLQVDASIIPQARHYLQITAFTLPIITLWLPIRYMSEGIGKASAVACITASTIPINIIGNYIFLNGLFGLPKMGAAGIGLASLLANLYLLVVYVLYLRYHKNFRHLFLLRRAYPPDRPIIWRLLYLGFPSAMAMLLEAGMFSTVVLLSGKLGITVAAANQIAFNYISNTFMIPLGISMALATRIGHALGKNAFYQARVIGISGIFLGAFFMFFSVLSILFFGKHIATYYTHNQAVIEVAYSILILAGFFQIFDGVQVCAGGALRGLLDTKSPMYYAAIGYWLLAVPSAVILTFGFGFGARGLWIGLMVGLSVTAVLCTRKFLQKTAHFIAVKE